MFTLYGNQYENREEHLLLTMFQVGLTVYYYYLPLVFSNLVLTFGVTSTPVCAFSTIRDYHGVRLTLTSQYSCLKDDDNLYPSRSGSKLSQERAR